MKSLLKILLFVFLPFLVASCEEDESKTILTDLSVEANQLFGISSTWGESLYFALVSFEDYSQIPSVEFPGCPDILVESQAKRITLTFDSSKACEQSGKLKRNGKLVIQYPLSASTSSKWSLTYVGYSLQNDSIQGTREFNLTALDQVMETFTNVKISSNLQVNSTISGTLNHTLTKFRNKLTGFSSMGTISGVNPAGRLFLTELKSPRQSLISCYSQNEVLPISGKEIWTVNRGKNQTVTHSLSYESSGSCTTTATVRLSDGRNLQVTL